MMEIIIGNMGAIEIKCPVREISRSETLLG